MNKSFVYGALGGVLSVWGSILLICICALVVSLNTNPPLVNVSWKSNDIQIYSAEYGRGVYGAQSVTILYKPNHDATYGEVLCDFYDEFGRIYDQTLHNQSSFLASNNYKNVIESYNEKVPTNIKCYTRNFVNTKL